MIKKIIFTTFILLFAAQLFAFDFYNKNLKSEELATLESGEVLIKNIAYPKNMCLKEGFNSDCDRLIKEIKDLSPKYLAEIIQVKPYKGNEDLPQILSGLLYNVSEYSGIPYWSERNQKYYDLYDSAQILSEKNITETQKELNALFVMSPFGNIYETIQLEETKNLVYYSSINTNKLRYKDDFDCVWPNKLKICILLFRDGENWVLYGIGGVNAPRIPFFTERIETSFINRIKTFCNFIFSKF